MDLKHATLRLPHQKRNGKPVEKEQRRASSGEG
jgi:hypothetical protein